MRTGVIVLVVGLTVAGAYAQQKKFKNQGEYDLYSDVAREADPAKKLQYLNQWVERYPDSDYYEEQLRLYSDLNQPAKVSEVQRIAV